VKQVEALFMCPFVLVVRVDFNFELLMNRMLIKMHTQINVSYRFYTKMCISVCEIDFGNKPDEN